MKKSNHYPLSIFHYQLYLTLSLFAAVLLCGCNGAFDPTEEPVIRSKGIEDRIYLTSEDHPEKDTHCTVTFEESKLILTFDKAFSFILSLWNNDKNTLFFGKKYNNANSCTIDLSKIEDGSFSIFIDNSFLCQFDIRDGLYVEQGSIEIAERVVKMFDKESMFVEVRYSFEEPKLEFSSSLYPYPSEELEGWPFGIVEKFSTSISFRNGESIEDTASLYIQRDSFPITRWHFSLGTEFILRTTTHGSLGPEYTLNETGEKGVEGDKPNLGGQTFSYEGKPLDDLRTNYTRGIMLPSEFKEFTKQTDEKGLTSYIASLPVVVFPATMPFLIEIIDKNHVMSSVEFLSVEGFAAQYSLSVCEPSDVSCIMVADKILPMKSVLLPDGSSANIVAGKLRTWGRAGNSPIILSYTVISENGNAKTFSSDVTSQVIAQPGGGVISVFVPHSEPE